MLAKYTIRMRDDLAKFGTTSIQLSSCPVGGDNDNQDLACAKARRRINIAATLAGVKIYTSREGAEVVARSLVVIP